MVTDYGAIENPPRSRLKMGQVLIGSGPRRVRLRRGTDDLRGADASARRLCNLFCFGSPGGESPSGGARPSPVRKRLARVVHENQRPRVKARRSRKKLRSAMTLPPYLQHPGSIPGTQRNCGNTSSYPDTECVAGGKCMYSGRTLELWGKSQWSETSPLAP